MKTNGEGDMNFYFIYSAGGGAGDWNGVKRVWNAWMPEYMKSKILLKFGDVFLEHASGNRIIRPQRWRNINNLRDWLYDNVDDNFIYTENCNILLDSGTAKAVNLIAHHNPTADCDELIDTFDRIFEENNIFEKYISVVCDSEMDSAVTFDIPNPFKIRSQNGNARLNIIERESNYKLIVLSAQYSNIIYDGIRRERGTDYADSVITTIINGTWSQEEIDLFLSKLEYNPDKIAIGALSSTSISPDTIGEYLDNLEPFGFDRATQLHFLGCGGFKKADAIKRYGFDGENVSVDCSTFINRSIDGRTDGANQSGYFDYVTKELTRIRPDTKNQILRLHSRIENPLYSCEELEDIIDTILLHQSGHSSPETYNSRARLMFHNADVYRYNAEE